MKDICNFGAFFLDLVNERDALAFLTAFFSKP